MKYFLPLGDTVKLYHLAIMKCFMFFRRNVLCKCELVLLMSLSCKFEYKLEPFKIINTHFSSWRMMKKLNTFQRTQQKYEVLLWAESSTVVEWTRLLLPWHRCGPTKVGKTPVQWDREQHRNSCPGAFMSALHPFLAVVLEKSRYVEGRDYKVTACSSGRMCLKWKQNTGESWIPNILEPS